MARPEAFKELLKDNDFTEEVDGKFIKYFNETYEEVFFGDPLDNCAVWYEEFDDFYWLGKQISYEQFRRNLDQYNVGYRDSKYSVNETDLVRFVGCLADKISQLCIQKHFVPDIVLDNSFDTWKKYNSMLKEGGADFYTNGVRDQLKELIELKKRKLYE